jgi:hypothetical protein
MLFKILLKVIYLKNLLKFVFKNRLGYNLCGYLDVFMGYNKKPLYLSGAY